MVPNIFQPFQPHNLIPYSPAFFTNPYIYNYICGSSSLFNSLFYGPKYDQMCGSIRFHPLKPWFLGGCVDAPRTWPPRAQTSWNSSVSSAPNWSGKMVENGGFFSNEMGRWPLKKQHIQGVGADVWTNNPTGRVIDHPSPPRQTAAHVSPSKMTYKRTGSEKSNMRCHTSNAWKPRASSQWQKDPSPSSRLTMTSLTMHSSNESATSAVIFRKRRLDSLPASSLAQTSLNILMYQQLKCLSSALLKDRRCLFLF